MIVGFPHPIMITRDNVDIYTNLTDEQANAVYDRDMILASNLGVSFDDYMSLIAG